MHQRERKHLSNDLKFYFEIFQDEDFLSYLKDQIDDKEKELFIVVSKDIEQNQGWLLESLDNGNETNATINAENGNVIISNNENEENSR